PGQLLDVGQDLRPVALQGSVDDPGDFEQVIHERELQMRERYTCHIGSSSGGGERKAWFGESTPDAPRPGRYCAQTRRGHPLDSVGSGTAARACGPRPERPHRPAGAGGTPATASITGWRSGPSLLPAVVGRLVSGLQRNAFLRRFGTNGV